MEKTKSRKKVSGIIDPLSHVYAKVPPHNSDMEEAILGAIMLEADAIHEVIQVLSFDMFYKLSHQLIYQAMVQLHTVSRKIDMLTVTEQLRVMGKLDEAGGPGDVSKCTSYVVSSGNISEHCFIVKNHWQKREAIRLGAELVHSGYNEEKYADDIFSQLSSDMMKVQDVGDISNDGDLTRVAVEMIKEMNEREPGRLLGLDTGIMLLNGQIAGLCEPDLIIVAARPGQGKTAVAKQLAYNLSVLQGIPGDYYSLEMAKKQLFYLMASSDTGISHDRIRKNVLTDDEKKILYKSIGKIASSPLRIDDGAVLTWQKLRAKALIAKRKRDIKYLIVDYLQLMTATNPNAPREQQISEISRELKKLAKELKIPVVALSQLSRECEKRPDKRPQLSDLRESGAIEQDADIVLFLMRPEYYGFKDPVEIGNQEYHPRGLIVTIIAKNRHNAPGTFPMQADLSISRVLDYGYDC
jgi:replicative DNA helicase